ncbi:MAG: zinc transport system substrate-binding protein [Candidatus Sumerlaeota bacterium]|nr:zinc transport system substrate-binding protein [Candidatus Sumerlaeota bacterium]
MIRRRAPRNRLSARKGWLTALLCALFLVTACQRTADSGRPTAGATPEVITTAAFVQSWTADLLDGVEKPVVVFDQNLAADEPKIAPGQAALLANARLLVSTGTETDAFIRAAREKEAASAPTAAPFAMPAERTWIWLDLSQAIAGVRTLSTRLQDVFPQEAAKIAANETDLTARLEALDERLLRLAAPIRGSEVFLQDSRLTPFAEHYGLTVAGLLSHRQGMAPTSEEIEAFQRAAARHANPILLAGTQISGDVLEVGEESATVTLVIVDPVLAGYVGRGHYERAMEGNAMVLVPVLAHANGGS